GDIEDADALYARLSAMPAGEMLDLARAFSHFLNLANIAEQHHQVRSRRLRFGPGGDSRSGEALADELDALRRRGIGRAAGEADRRDQDRTGAHRAPL